MRRRQSGIALILVVVGLVAILAMAGLALDTGRLVLNKSRLQNATDAAALAAAKVLDQTHSIVQADAAALAIFDQNAAANGDISAARAGITFQTQYSETLNPFTPGAADADANYVRVIASNLAFATTFARVVGIDSLDTGARAVAGPSPALTETCDVAPVLACADTSAGAVNYGYDEGDLTVLKIGAKAESPVGPGNFRLLQVDGSSSGADIRDALAGKSTMCRTSSGTVVTAPGNKVDPTDTGIEQRFDTSKKYGMVPDVIVQEPEPLLMFNLDTGNLEYSDVPIDPENWTGFNYDAYRERLDQEDYDNAPPLGEFNRRILVVPIGVCTGDGNGVETIQVLKFGCFFLIQDVHKKLVKGTGAGQTNFVVGEYREECSAKGTGGATPGTGPGPYVIQLYRDYESSDS